MNYKFILVDVSTGNAQREWILQPPVTIGRCPTADITINDESLSRKHCQFLINPHGSLCVRDLKSKNGVYVDHQKVERAIVPPGLEIRMGLLTLRVEMTEEDVIDEYESGEVYDLGETKPVEIYRPEDDRYEIG